MIQNSIKDTHKTLRYIHSLYGQLKTLESRWKGAERRFALHKEKIEDAEHRYAEIKETYTGMLLKVREAENRFSLCEAELKRRKNQLIEAKNNKEYKSLTDQIAGDRIRSDKLAEEVLLLTAEAEKFKPEVSRALEEVNKTKSSENAAEKELKELYPVIKNNLEFVKKELAETIPKISREYSGNFHRVVKAMGGGNGMAQVSGTDEYYCGACRIKIPLHYIVEMCEGKSHLCSCGRLLYFPEDFAIHND